MLSKKRKRTGCDNTNVTLYASFSQLDFLVSIPQRLFLSHLVQVCMVSVMLKRTDKKKRNQLTMLAVVLRLKLRNRPSTIGNATVRSALPSPSIHFRIPSKPSTSLPNTITTFPSVGHSIFVAHSLPYLVKKNRVPPNCRIRPAANCSQLACTSTCTCSQ